MSELLPCPFCGGEAEIRTRKVHHTDWFGKDYRIMYRVRCRECGATVGRIAACEYHKDERTGKEWGAVIDWNTRAERTCETCDQMDNPDSFIRHLLNTERTEITRCRDCKHLNIIGKCPCGFWALENLNGFCAWGTKKEDE